MNSVATLAQGATLTMKLILPADLVEPQERPQLQAVEKIVKTRG
jgi:hypothetical protein